MEIIRNPENYESDNVLKKDKRKEGKELFDKFLECADGRFIVEFNISYLRLLLDPEGYTESQKSTNWTLGNGAGEPYPNGAGEPYPTGARSGGRRHTKKSHRRSKRKQTRRRK